MKTNHQPRSEYRYLGATIRVTQVALEGSLFADITHWMSLSGQTVLGYESRPITNIAAALWHVRKRIRRDRALFARRAK